MKVLLDVCTPVQVHQALPGHAVHTAVKMGWGELDNGGLLGEAEAAKVDPGPLNTDSPSRSTN